MKVTIAASQMACSWNLEKNIEKAINIVHQSADQGAQIVLLQELFETPYFVLIHKASILILQRHYLIKLQLR